MNWEFTDVQAGFQRCRETRDQIAHIHWIMEKAKEFQKNIRFCFIDYLKPLTMWMTENCRKFSMRWEYWTTLPVFWETRMHVKKEQLVLNMEQWFKIGKDYDIKCHSAYLTFMQSTSWEMLGWMNPKLESRLLGEISTTADMQMISF